MLIYKVEQLSKDNAVVYVGQTVSSLQERVAEHRYSMKRCKHHFANALNKYGFDDFVFTSIDYAETMDELNVKEIQWINRLKPQYNMTPGGDAQRRFSKKVKHLQTGIIYDSVAEAAEKLGILRVLISRMVNGKEEHAKGQTFSYDLSAPLCEEVTREWVKRSVKHLQTGKVYVSCTKAAAELGLCESSVSSVAAGKTRQIKGNTFSYDLLKEIEPAVKKPGRKEYGPSPFRKPFKNLQTGRIYNSLQEAADSLNTSSGHISNVLNGKLRHIKGFSFSYDLESPQLPPIKRKNAKVVD